MLSKMIRESYTAVPRLETYPHYAEEGQDFPVLFESFFQNELGHYHLLHGPVKCRDFLGDIVCSYTFNNSSSIYGFETNVPEWAQEMVIDRYGLKVTFPTDIAAQNCIKNLNSLLYLFKLSGISGTIEQFLSVPKREVFLTIPILPPVLLSLFTWIVKLSGQDLSDATLQACLRTGNVIQFSERFPQVHKNKDASYFSRVNPEVFLWGELMCHLCVTSQSFAYLEEHKDNISFLHNNSGFFSQFHKQTNAESTKKFRRLLGTIILCTKQQAPFEFTPLSKEEFNHFTYEVGFHFEDPSGKAWTLSNNSITSLSEYREKQKKANFYIDSIFSPPTALNIIEDSEEEEEQVDEV